MAKITSAKAYANNEVALIAWKTNGPIPGCLGFEITRIYENGEERPLAAWVPFEGQTNEDWKPQTTSVWPVQKFFWRDLTVRRRRDSTSLRDGDVTVKYKIRPVCKAKQGLVAIVTTQPKDYQGDPVPLSYVDDGIETNPVTITTTFDSVRVAFTNGILSTQWLSHSLQDLGDKVTPDALRKHIADKTDDIRKYLTGDVLGLLESLLQRADQSDDAEVCLALYELGDKELVDLLVKSKKKVRLILSNSSKERGGDTWDAGNGPFRKTLEKAGLLELENRMFNNGHIGHNKFAVLLRKGKPKAVLTGSTNWTPNGLCAQSNNAMIIEDDAVAAAYHAYWLALKTDTGGFVTPHPLGKATSNVQSAALRKDNAAVHDTVTLANGTTMTIWRAPNTPQKSKGTATPPDLAAVYEIMAKAQQAILFAVFLPSRSGKTSVVEKALELGTSNRDLLVYGSVSDPTAMPNYVPPPPKSEDDDDGETREHHDNPATYDKGKIHVVRASALGQNDLMGAFEAELLKAGNAIIHDKIVVIDPLSEDCAVVMGSHNMGFKASYENDENLIIIRKNRQLAQAYAVHLLDLYDHYRFRALQTDRTKQNKGKFSGFLAVNDKWQEASLKNDRKDLADYFG